MVIAFAGRRIDPPVTDQPRFPLINVINVAERLDQFFSMVNPGFVVGAGACGADLLVLDAAGRAGVKRRMILPFDSSLFKLKSVIDRPGDWGPLFSKILEDMEANDEVVNLGYDKQDHEAYEKTNIAILDNAELLTKQYYPATTIIALLVWDCKPKNSGDATWHLKEAALKKHMIIKEINTLI